MATSGSSKRMPPRKSRRKRTGTSNISIDGTAEDLKSWTCRKCLKNRRFSYFYKATDPILDTNGHMSVCRYCIEDLYEKYYISEGSLEKAILKLCKMLNVRYDATALEATIKGIETSKSKGKNVTGIFGIYRRNLVKGGYGGFTSGNDLTYQGSLHFETSEDWKDEIQSEDDIQYLEEAWGKNLTIDDYKFLEESYAKWQDSIVIDNRGMEILVRELCHKENEIRKQREGGNHNVDSLLKSMQEIMKNSALTPALQNAASNNRNAEAFGVWIRDIEDKTPAEWWQDQDKYKDMDNIEDYHLKYITRPIKNFIVGSRDFNVEEALEIQDDGDIDMDD